MATLDKYINDAEDVEKIIRYIMPFFFKCLMAPLGSKISFCLPNINFVFSEPDIEEISSYLPNLSQNGLRDKLLKMRNNAFNLKQVPDTIVSDNSIYINVPDYKEFFLVLYRIYTKSTRNFYLGLRQDNLINSIWLRMGVEDILDVMSFLNRQLEFIENEKILADSYNYGHFADWDNIKIYYMNEQNADWFETNRCLTFYWSQIEHDGEFKPFKRPYMLPSIHYGLARENGELTCYIYGIQNFSSDNDSILESFRKETQAQIRGLKKTFRNHHVSTNFAIALKYFIELLEKKGITTIKVPFFQVFNYDYHVSLSDEHKTIYGVYSDDDKLEYEEKAKNGQIDEMVAEYLDIKSDYDRFADKQDIVSRNKIDRFLQVFMLLSEKMGNIEVNMEPALNGEFYIIVKIKSINLEKNASHLPNSRK